MNNMYKRNLVRMANYLWNLPQESFGMNIYLKNVGGIEIGPDEHECGSIGCVIGHSIYLQDIEGKKGDYLWVDVATSIFGEDNFSDGYGRFIFSSDWELEDNTPQGAARRIIHVLTGGEYTDDFDPSVYQHLDISDLPSINNYKD